MSTKTKKEPGISPAALSALAVGDIDNFLVASTPGGIEAQEKRGQLRQSEKETLPVDGTSKPEDRKQFEALGFKFTGVKDGLFEHVDFPQGWKKNPTDHSMWSELLDDKGQVRGMIFYKAAFYDQRANVHLSRRFGVHRDYERKDRAYIKDARGLVSKEITGLPEVNWSGDRDVACAADDKHEAARRELIDWLKANYPDFDSPTAYWS